MAGYGGSTVPGFLGRVLDAGGSPVGTCFQVGGSVLVTAWHVLVDAGADIVGDTVLVDSLAAGGADSVSAQVVAGDAVHDLAVLLRTEPLPASEPRLAASSAQGIGVGVAITGHGLLDDPGKAPLRHADAPGEWAGGAMREEAVSLAVVDSKRVLRGMSGAPVRRLVDGVIVGVVSARYNSADGWFRDTVWVARIEDLQPLLDQVPEWHAPALLEAPRLTGAADVDLEVDGSTVRLVGAGIDVTAPHHGISFGLTQALAEVRSARARAGTHRTAALPDDAEAPGLSVAAVSLRRAGALLAQSFLPGPLAQALAGVLGRAAAAGMPVRIGVRATAGFTQLPWEALPDPIDQAPLALHRLVTVYRKVPAGGVRPVPWPLRIVVAIAAPTSGGGALLDYERELRMVHRAVREARGSDAVVRVVPFATTTAIREALEGGQVHVLHLSGHGGPGVLILENDDGQARRVTAAQFQAEAVPPGCMPAVICLAACYTDVPAADGAASFAADLAKNGAAAVIATETSVTDRYATRVFARTYKNLAAAKPADVVAALAQARREVHRELAAATDPRDRQIADLDEWGTVTVLAGDPVTVIGDPAHTDPQAARPDPSTRSFRGLTYRLAGEFVGRRVEQHQMPRVLLDDTEVRHHGVLLAGIGGVGKTTLAVEVLRRVTDRDPNRMVVTVVGATNVDQVLAEIAAPARQTMTMSGQTGVPAFRAVQLAGQVDLPWQDRWQLLREHLVDQAAVMLVLDNFEDNLTDPDSDDHRRVRIDNLADLLADILTDPGRTRLLITSRHPFRLPRDAETSLWQRYLGPLTLAETLKLVWGLPRLDTLDDTDLEHIWRVVGGHPRTLEYLDALLDQGQGRFPDISQRLTDQVRRRLKERATAWLAADRDLDAALADAVTVAADDVLLPELLQQIRPVPDAEDALLGLSVYRTPVDPAGLLFQIGAPDTDAAWTPDRQGIRERITTALAPHDLDLETLIGLLNSGDTADLPDGLLDRVTPDLQELDARPHPGRRWPQDPGPVRDTLVRSSLLTIDPDNETLFVHRWTASELARIWQSHLGGFDRLLAAHRRAADYWRWRVSAWPQDRAADIDDLIEARYHLIQAGDIDEAIETTDKIVGQLYRSGAWDRAIALVQQAFTLLADPDPRRAHWLYWRGVFAQSRGDYEQAEDLFSRALAIDLRFDNEAAAGAEYHQLGMLAQIRGRYEEAENLFHHALDIATRFADWRGAATDHHHLGMLAEIRGDHEEAKRQYHHSIDIKESRGDQEGAASTKGQLGNLALEHGDYETAEHFFRQAMATYERFANLRGIADTSGHLAGLALQRADYDAAGEMYRRSVDIHERLGDQAGAAAGYHHLGIVAQIRGDPDEAERQFRRSLDISERVGHARAASTYHNLGILAQERGDWATAEWHYRRCLRINRQHKDQAGIARAHQHLGSLSFQKGDYEQAGRQFQRSLEINQKLGNTAGLAITYHNLGNVALMRDDLLEAERRYQAALEMNELLNNHDRLADALAQLGTVALRRRDAVTAEQHFIRCLEIKERIDEPAGIATTLHMLGNLAQVRGDWDEADRQYHRSLEINERLGRRPGIAQTVSQLGLLESARGRDANAVPLHIRALSIRTELGVPATSVDIQALRRLRADLGDEPFQGAAETVLDRKSFVDFLNLLGGSFAEGC